MQATLEIDKLGRLLVPKKLREALQLKPGDQLQAEMSGGVLTLQPQPTPRGLHEHHGRLVFDGGEVSEVDVVALIQEDRERRTRHILGLPEDL